MSFLRYRTIRALVLALGLIALRPVSARAGCDLIPQAQPIFRGALGTLDRPFAGPGDFIELHRPPLCGQGSPRLPESVDDLVVTLLFKPISGPRHVVVLTTQSCDDAGLGQKLATCDATPEVDGVSCVQMNPTDMDIVKRDGIPRLRFRFPNTDVLLDGVADDRALAGPATIAVSRRSDPALPCGLVSATCTTQAAALGLVACIDDLFARDGTCAPNPDPTFRGFTALPPPSDYQATCFTEDPPCTAAATETRLTLDRDGNLFIPVYWQGILVKDGDQPVPRLLRASIKPPVPVTIPSAVFVSSLTTEGQRLPPIFEPQADPTAASTDALAFFGSVDVRQTVLRIAHRRGICQGGSENGADCNSTLDCNGAVCVDACVGGSNDGLACGGGCPNGRCGELYDAAAFAALAGDGAVVIPKAVPSGIEGICQASDNAACTTDAQCTTTGDTCVLYALEAQQSVSLDSLTTKTDNLFVLTSNEAVDRVDRNGDADVSDLVVSLRERTTGKFLSLGAPSGFAVGGAPLPTCGILDPPPKGRAIFATNLQGFELPAVAFEGGVAAFLESEAGENACDENGDGDRADAILRIFSLTGGEVALSPPRALDPLPLVNGQTLAISNGRVFFRTSEASSGRQVTTLVSIDAGIGADAEASLPGADISRDGALVAFVQRLPFDGIDDDGDDPDDDADDGPEVFVRNRGAGTTERVSVPTRGDGRCGGADGKVSVSGNGRFVAFASSCDLLVPGDTNRCSGRPCKDVFVRDRELGTTERVSVGPGGAQANGHSGSPVVSDNGRFVAFTSRATRLVGSGDTNRLEDVFVHDRCVADGVLVPGCVPATERVSVTDDEQQMSGVNTESRRFDMSADGRFVAFDFCSTSSNCAVYVRDREAGTTEQVSSGQLAFAPAISSDGRFVVYQFVQGGGRTARDIGLYDRTTHNLDVVNVLPDGSLPPTESSFEPSVSDDGHFVLFRSDSPDLIGPGRDTNGTADLFVRDRVFGVTERVSVGADGIEATDHGGVLSGSFSRDGTRTLFVSGASNLVVGDTNGAADLFVREPVAGDDVVLEVLETQGGRAAGNVTTLCPAGAVTAAFGMTAFLRPEAPIGAGTPECPSGSLNGDSDLADQVAQLWPGSGAVQNLGRAATAVALSATHVAAIVSEAGQGDGGSDLNGDEDKLDGVAQVYPIAGGPWASLGRAADTIAFCGSVLAFITPEDAQNADLNGDQDTQDRVLHLYDPATGTVVNLGQAVEEFVCNDRVVAFRTSEAAQGGTDLEGTAVPGPYAFTEVMQGYRLDRPECLTNAAPADCLVNSRQAAERCSTAACDPRVPYKVSGCSVKFLTPECFQRGDVDPGYCEGTGGGTDLNGDTPPDARDTIIQVFDVCNSEVTVAGTVSGDRNPFQSDEGDGQGAAIFVASGRCIETLGGSCVANAECATGAFCDKSTNTCKRDHRPCVTALECPPTVPCVTDENGRILAASPDTDNDGVPDHLDNCPDAANPNQEDTDGDRAGDACDLDSGGPTPTPLNHFQCFEIHRPPFNRAGVSLVDQFGSSTVTIKRAKRICAPADKNGEDPTAATDPEHLTFYTIKQTSPLFTPVKKVTVTNEFGSLIVNVDKPDRLLVPTAKSLTTMPGPLTAPIDHFKCYRVSGAPFRRAGIALKTQLGTLTVDIKTPRHLCTPVNKNGEDPTAPNHSDHLMCYLVRGPRPETQPVLFTTNQFGPDSYTFFGPRELCVPSTMTLP